MKESTARKPQPLTDKQERFCAEVAKGASYSAAYKIAYPTANTWADRSVWNKASELARHGGVLARIDHLRKPSIEADQYGVQEALSEADKYMLEAAKDRAWGPVGQMMKLKMQIKGLLLQKVEVGSVGDFGKFDAHKKLAMIQTLEIEMEKRKALGADVEDAVDKLDAGEG